MHVSKRKFLICEIFRLLTHGFLDADQSGFVGSQAFGWPAFHLSPSP